MDSLVNTINTVNTYTVLVKPFITSLPRNVKVKAEVNSFSIESESENGIFLFILFTPGQRRVKYLVTLVF